MNILAEVGAALVIVTFLAMVAEALVEFFIAPIWDRYGIEKFWLAYVAAAVGAALVFVSGQNLLDGYLPANLAILGRILTALLAGRGSNWVHDFFSKNRHQIEALGGGATE